MKEVKCPNCGASIKIESEYQSTVFCDYCDSSFYLPDLYKKKQTAPQTEQQTYTIDLSGYQKTAAKASSIVITVIAVFAMILVGGIVAFILTLSNNGSGGMFGESEPSFVKKALTFGEEGSGQGYFTDVRSVGVGRNGDIFIAGYSDRRIQRFNSQGEFEKLWLVDEDIYIQDMEVDEQNQVYIVGNGKIYVYDGESGEFLGFFQSGEENYYIDDIAFDPEGNIWAITRGENLIKFNPQGKMEWFKEGLFENTTGDSELNGHLAIDGYGNIYVIGTFNSVVLKFSSQGEYVNRFGGDGDEPGQFRAMQRVTVDNQGRVYVSDFRGIQVFDENGRYLDIIKHRGVSFGMTVDDKNYLYSVNGTCLIKYKIEGNS